MPPAPDNFNIVKNEEFNEVAKMPFVKGKDLKRKCLGNKPNAAQPLEEDEIKEIWSSGAVGLQNPRCFWPSCLVEKCHPPVRNQQICSRSVLAKTDDLQTNFSSAASAISLCRCNVLIVCNVLMLQTRNRSKTDLHIVC